MDFTITAGPGGGESINNDAVGPVTVATNSLGRAAVTLNSGTVPGTVRVRARSGTVVSTATQVTIRSGPPAFISCTAEDCNVPSWGKTGFGNKITAAVVDQWGNEVADSTAVWFGTEQGLIEGAAETQTVETLRGKAITYWNSAQPRNDGTVYFWCKTAGGSVADTSSFIESGPAGAGAFIEWPNALLASGDQTGKVVIEVLDGNGMFMDTNTPIDLRTDFGSIASGVLLDGCLSSTYIGYYISTPLGRDYSYSIPDNGVGAIATITANVGGTAGFTDVASVSLLTGRAETRFSELRMVGSVHQGAFVPIEVEIRDFQGNPLGGHRIEITVQDISHGIAGSISGSPQYTDEYGIASGFIFKQDNPDYPCVPPHLGYITAKDLDANHGGLVLVHSFTVHCQ